MRQESTHSEGEWIYRYEFGGVGYVDTDTFSTSRNTGSTTYWYYVSLALLPEAVTYDL
jgi:hypothetical protein